MVDRHRVCVGTGGGWGGGDLMGGDTGWGVEWMRGDSGWVI